MPGTMRRSTIGILLYMQAFRAKAKGVQAVQNSANSTIAAVIVPRSSTGTTESTTVVQQ